MGWEAWSRTLAAAWHGLGSPEWDTGSDMTWAGKSRVGHWQRHGMGWEIQSGTLAVAWHGLGSPEWDTGSGMAWVGKSRVGHWQQHGMGWEVQSGTLVAYWLVKNRFYLDKTLLKILFNVLKYLIQLDSEYFP
eukprot:g43465.t1